jgi:hypothetical protein
MNETAGEIKIGYTDKYIDKLLARLPSDGAPCCRHFSQNEEFFLKLPGKFTVSSFPVHHNVRDPVPGKQYLKTLYSVIAEITQLAPDVFRGLTYFFNPGDIFRPAFYQVYHCNGRMYLLLVCIDLHWKAREHTLVKEAEDNTKTVTYSSDKLFLEADLIPLESVLERCGKISGFRIHQSVSQTWIDEYGSGYRSQGIWIDKEFTKFFSKLFTPPDKKLYPYYPFTCKYRAVCFSLLEPEEKKRDRDLSLLHEVQTFIAPHIPSIEEVLKCGSFSENLEMFISLREQVPAEWRRRWDNVNIIFYLNTAEMKEFRIEISA